MPARNGITPNYREAEAWQWGQVMAIASIATALIIAFFVGP